MVKGVGDFPVVIIINIIFNVIISAEQYINWWPALFSNNGDWRTLQLWVK